MEMQPRLKKYSGTLVETIGQRKVGYVLIASYQYKKEEQQDAGTIASTQ